MLFAQVADFTRGAQTMRSIRFRRLRALRMLLPMSFFMLLNACQLAT